MADYYSVITDKGAALEAAAIASGGKVNLTKFVVGDGNGQFQVPNPASTKLVHEVYRGDISGKTVSPEQPNQTVVQLVLPADVGGFTIRELGLLTDAGELFAIGNCAAIEKPENGVNVTVNFRLAVSPTDDVTLIVATGDGLFLRQDANLGDVKDKAKARGNLALKGAALLDVGKAAGTVAAGDDSRIVSAVPNVRKVNGRALTADINITSQDIFNGQTIGIGNAADLNAYTTPGLYYQPANTQAGSGKNYPEPNAGSLEVYKHAGITQVYRIYNNSRSYVRTQYSGAWSGWTKIYDTANKPTAAEISAITQDSCSTAGFNSNNVAKPYMRHTSSNAVVQLATESWVTAGYQPKGSYTPAGQAYTKAESDGLYINAVQRGSQVLINGSHGGLQVWEAPAGCYMTGVNIRTDLGDCRYMGYYYRSLMVKTASGSWRQIGG